MDAAINSIPSILLKLKNMAQIPTIDSRQPKKLQIHKYHVFALILYSFSIEIAEILPTNKGIEHAKQYKATHSAVDKVF